MHVPYPTLSMLDQARGDGSRPFCADPAATELESAARRLIGAYCSDTVWLTGDISGETLATICAALEAACRVALPVTLLVSDLAPQPAA